MIEDAQNSGTVVVQFADGTKADTGVILPSLLGNYLELLEPPAAASMPVPAKPSNEPGASASGPAVAIGGNLAASSTRQVIQPRPEAAGEKTVMS
jgi:hypothetical protein